MTSRPQVAQRLFAPIGGTYERWATVLSLGQDPRWRRRMVAELHLTPGDRVLDVAAGTGSITRLLEAQGARVTAVDQSPGMLRHIDRSDTTRVLATAERLPFADESFDAVTFGYLLRYVDDVGGVMTELGRVLRPGGMVGMVEFGRPRGGWRPLWWLYTRLALPAAGAVIGGGWYEVGRFLGPDIDAYVDAWPVEDLAAAWGRAGFDDVRFEAASLGGATLGWGRRR